MSTVSPTLSVTDGLRPERGTALVRGTTLGRYVVLDLLGSGGMGVVYAAYDFGLDRRVCLKLVRDTGGDRSAERQERLLREARAAARISHPNVVTVHDVGTWEDHVFVAMELVEGGTLRRWLRQAERSRRELLDAFVQAGRGLAAAHGSGLVHRDFKPDNVLVGADGRIRVTDFGLARSISTGPGSDAGHTSGTPAYMAPEQHRGEPATPATDQFAFALALYEAVFGESPYRAQDPASLRAAKAAGAFAPPPMRARVSQGLYTSLLRAMSPEPKDRFPTMNALLEAIRPKRRAARLWTIVGSAAASASAALVLVSHASAPAASAPVQYAEAVTVSTRSNPSHCAVAPPPDAAEVTVLFAASSEQAANAPVQRSARSDTPAPLRSAPAPTFFERPTLPTPVARAAPSFTVHAREEEEGPASSRLLQVLAKLQSVLEELGVLDAAPAQPGPMLASAVLPGNVEQSRAEYVLGRFGEALAQSTPRAVQVGGVFPSTPIDPNAEEIARLEAALAEASGPVERAKIQFRLARALYSVDRTRAIALAREARESLQQTDLPDTRLLLEEVEGWLEWVKPVIHRSRGP